MTPSEASDLLTRCAGFDNRQPSAAAAIAWASALQDLPLDQDTFAAVDRFYGTPPKDPSQRLWIQPHDVRRIRRTIRSERLENFQYQPLPDETTGEYLARYRGQVQAIASGRVTLPTGRLAIEGGPSASFMQQLEDHGWEGTRSVPGSDEESLADSVRRAGPLGVECPSCGAAMGRPCKTPGGGEKQPLGKPRAKPHSARLRAAAGKPELTVEQRAAEEQRIREASARALARMQAEENIPDAEIVEDA
ncbi:zinc finger domain-containing protein [Streptomyces enissocaesilis]|uniref:DNA-binding phage zinc finger domain-containing protein n=1 Tax=Streptomyces enissocaesilis TaxID=332589 RepID=A0ABN3WYV2_9ACTN